MVAVLRCCTATSGPHPYKVDPSSRLTLFWGAGNEVDALPVFDGARPYSLMLVSAADVSSLRLRCRRSL